MPNKFLLISQDTGQISTPFYNLTTLGCTCFPFLCELLENRIFILVIFLSPALNTVSQTENIQQMVGSIQCLSASETPAKAQRYERICSTQVPAKRIQWLEPTELRLVLDTVFGAHRAQTGVRYSSWSPQSLDWC